MIIATDIGNKIKFEWYFVQNVVNEARDFQLLLQSLVYTQW